MRQYLAKRRLVSGPFEKTRVSVETMVPLPSGLSRKFIPATE
jgi:hypothetical protein